MLETRNLFYIDVDKTSCTHVHAILSRILKEKIYYSQHTSPVNAAHVVNLKTKYGFATLRNPWDWYVSMWRFECKKGLIGEKIYDTNKWTTFIGSKLIRSIEYYSDNLNDINRFQKWFDKLFAAWGQDNSDLFSQYSKNCLGVYSVFYIQRKYPQEIWGLANEPNNILFKNLIEVDDAFEYLDNYICTHRLEEELISFLSKYCKEWIHEGFEETIYQMGERPLNTSAEMTEGRLPFTEFYTSQMRERVELWDRLILEKYDFKFDPKEDLIYKLGHNIGLNNTMIKRQVK